MSDFGFAGFLEMQVEVAEPLSKLCLEFPDIYLGIKSLTCLILFNFEGTESLCLNRNHLHRVLPEIQTRSYNHLLEGKGTKYEIWFHFFPHFSGSKVSFYFVFYRIVHGLTQLYRLYARNSKKVCS